MYVLLQMLTNGWEFGARRADHTELAYLPSPTQVKEGKSNYADLLVRARGAPGHKPSGIFSSADLWLELSMNSIDYRWETYENSP